ncbi:MAG: type II toxin-antitoxin system RelE family toxin [Mycobacteriales bacterium]
MVEVQLTEDALNDLQDLDRSAQLVIFKGLVKLQTNSRERGQPLGKRRDGDLTTFRKLVVGDRTYRIIYRVQPDDTVVVVWVIAGRADDEAYGLAVSRLHLAGSAEAVLLAGELEVIWSR